MKNKVTLIICVVLFLSGLAVSNSNAQDEKKVITGTDRQIQRWHFFLRENAIDQFWLKISEKHKSRGGSFAIVNTNLIDMVSGGSKANQTIIVRNGRIEAIGPSRETNLPKNVRRIDGTGKFVIPGLVDMHFHGLVSNSHHLLNIANGVTGVREMDGFAWMLDIRSQTAEGHLLAPNMYIAGHILNEHLMGFYATPVKTPVAARLAVNEQVAAGYDFIKVHNSLKPEIFSAILDEARDKKIDVVGHVPHGITVDKAIKSGMRTLEHFKGYILDSTLTLSKENYVNATRGKDVWNCPTFYTYRSHLRGEEAHSKVLNTYEMKYVSPADRLDWLALAKNKPDKLTKLRANIVNLSTKIFKDLRKADAKFIAGTDSGGGIPLLIPGFALIEELQLMEDRGMPPYDALKTATINAAKAMRRDGDFGTLEVGKRADLILLSKNPLETVRNLKYNKGVSVRGKWLSKSDIDEILEGIETRYQMNDLKGLKIPPTVQQIDMFLDELEKMRGKGFIFRNFDLGEISRLLLAAGLENRARRIRALKRR